MDEGRRISIPKIGAVKCKFHRPLEGTPKALQIVLDVDEWYAVYTCEVPKVALPETGSSVGVDVGTRYFAITSDGEFVENLKHLGHALKKLRVQQRTVARCKKGVIAGGRPFSRLPRLTGGFAASGRTSTTRPPGGWSMNTT